MKERSDIMVVDESMMSPRTKRQIRMYEELFTKFEDSARRRSCRVSISCTRASYTAPPPLG